MRRSVFGVFSSSDRFLVSDVVRHFSSKPFWFQKHFIYSTVGNLVFAHMVKDYLEGARQRAFDEVYEDPSSRRRSFVHSPVERLPINGTPMESVSSAGKYSIRLHFTHLVRLTFDKLTFRT